ncbi:hypothetical protein FQZ97_791670 [compost metagenome]
MSRARTPTGAKSAELQSVPFNTRAIPTNVAQDITDRFGLFRSCDIQREPPLGCMYAFVYLHTILLQALCSVGMIDPLGEQARYRFRWDDVLGDGEPK